MLPLILVAVGAYLIGDSVLEGGKKLAKGGKTDGGKIKFYEVVKSISDLEYDGDPEDLRLHHEERFSWGADNEKKYNDAAEEISKIEYKGKGWTVYAFSDTSSYDYWMKQQEEQNYIMITVMFDKETIDESEVENLRKALGKAIDEAENIAYRYDYVPQDHEDDDDDGDYKKGGKTQGYDDKKDESLAMKRGKIADKDFKGSLKKKERSRRDDAQFEERGKKVKGGKLIGKQKNLDVNKNGKLDAEDFKMLRKGK
jgi:hypothetical protein